MKANEVKPGDAIAWDEIPGGGSYYWRVIRAENGNIVVANEQFRACIAGDQEVTKIDMTVVPVTFDGVLIPAAWRAFIGDGKQDKLYEPSYYVGLKFKSLDGVCYCSGYNNAHGYWMERLEKDVPRSSVSERAIGRTYHRIWPPFEYEGET